MFHIATESKVQVLMAVINYVYSSEMFEKLNFIQYNLNGSNPDGSFIPWMIHTLFSVPTKSFQ